MSRGGGRRGPSKKVVKPEEDESFIIFGDGKSGKKAKSKENAGRNSITESPEQAKDAPKKPDTRQLIGGASWTGKLPVNLLSELCQKQKWDKPEYTMVHSFQRVSNSQCLWFAEQNASRVSFWCRPQEAGPEDKRVKDTSPNLDPSITQGTWVLCHGGGSTPFRCRFCTV